MRRTLTLATLVAVTASPMAAQQPERSRLTTRQEFYIGANMLVGGASALVQSLYHKETHPVRALLGGMAGGALIYSGKRIVGTQEPALRLAGLQTTALGANVVRNAGRGMHPLKQITLPLYPFYVQIDGLDAPHESGVRSRARLSALSAINTIRMASGAYGPARFNPKESLLTGLPVFTTSGAWLSCRAFYETSEPDPNCRAPLQGIASGGTLAYALRPEPTPLRPDQTPHQLRAHESVHAAQFIADALMHAVPAYDATLSQVQEDFWTAQQFRAGDYASALQRYVVLDFALPLSTADLLLRSQPAPRGTSYNELEADAMLGLDYCTRNNRRCSW
jgi:hypothetical protein